MIIADTNVVSEFMKDVPHPSVLQWAEGIAPADLSICVVTVAEIEHGLRRLPRGRRRDDRERRWARLLATFVDAVAAYDLQAARCAACVLVAAEASGRPMSLADAQIAGICLAEGFELATRNVSDFTPAAGLVVINPFD